MEWFRWYGGTLNDPKMQWVARQAGHNVAAVLAVWVAVLERAHNHEQRGCCDGLDFESMDVVLGLDDGSVHDIYQVMIRKGMIVDGNMVAAWEKRQPKREDENSTERVREFREREKLKKKIIELEKMILSVSSRNETSETQCNELEREEMTEESREEEKREDKTLESKEQQHAREQLAVVVEERREDLQRLFPDRDIPVAVEKLLAFYRKKPERLLDPWMVALKWFQREFREGGPGSHAVARASPEAQKSKALLREEANIEATQEALRMVKEMRDGQRREAVKSAVGVIGDFGSGVHGETAAAVSAGVG
ncbi:MAG: hypothetical protein ACOYL3_07135 [Desulfuromonadaceae bacterium]